MIQKKIRKIAFQLSILLTILFLIGSCSHKSDIEGTWIGTAFNRDGSRSGFISIQPLAHITSDSLFYRTVGYEEGLFEKVDSFTTLYNLDEKTLSLNNPKKNIILKYLSKDSIVAHYANDSSFQMSFNRIVDNGAMNFGDLVDQEFLFEGIDGSENSIYFVNDSIALEYHKKSEFVDIKKWETVNFKNQKFLVLSNRNRSESLHLDSISPGKLYLSRYGGAKSFTFKNLKTSDPLRNELMGHWSFDRVIDSVSSSISVLNKFKKYPYLSFSGTHLKFKDIDTVKSKEFILTRSGILVIYINEKITKSNIWKIDKINSAELHLIQYAPSGEFLIKTLYRKNPE